MGATRPAGPVCKTNYPTTVLDDGTMERWLFDSPAASPWEPSAAPSHAGAATGRGGDLEPAWCAVLVPDIEFLFRACRNPQRTWSDQGLTGAAKTLGVEEAAVLAVAEVETGDDSFDQYGRPKILFERHVFHALTGGRFDAIAPDLSASATGGYGTASSQYMRLERAYRLEPWAALKSASWGGFQIMGRYYAELGYPTPPHMVLEMAQSADGQLAGFAKYMRMNKTALRALRAKDWTGFARAYNGPQFAKNKYDTKLEAAYKKHKATLDKAVPSARGPLP
jgi:hypothetical protein